MEYTNTRTSQEVNPDIETTMQPAQLTQLKNSERVRIRAISKVAAEIQKAWDELPYSSQHGQSFQAFAERFLAHRAKQNGGSLQ